MKKGKLKKEHKRDNEIKFNPGGGEVHRGKFSSYEV